MFHAARQACSLDQRQETEAPLQSVKNDRGQADHCLINWLSLQQLTELYIPELVVVAFIRRQGTDPLGIHGLNSANVWAPPCEDWKGDRCVQHVTTPNATHVVLQKG